MDFSQPELRDQNEIVFWHNVRLLTMEDGAYGQIDDAALVVQNGRIAWRGCLADMPKEYRHGTAYDGQGCWVTPGLVDCHTHLIYAGNRSDEFEARLQGATYEAIAKRGGGILSTVRATREASMADLRSASEPRLCRLMAEGVTTVEIKSGYGLDLPTEQKILETARHFGCKFPVQVYTSFLGAHALPAEFADDPDRYIDCLCTDVLPALAAFRLVDAVDAFCEKIAFTTVQIERLFQVAKRLGLPVKIHAEQLSGQGGTKLAARHQALSADHLEWASAEDIEAMAKAGTVAVLLPGAFYYMRETRLPPIESMRREGVSIAVASDCNPGTCPMPSLLTAMNMACVLFRLTPLEALQGVTCHAAKALGQENRIGTLSVGKRADFVLWTMDRPADLCYQIGVNNVYQTVFAGQPRCMQAS